MLAKIKLKGIFLTFFLIGLSSVTVFSQAAIKLENGYLFIVNSSDKSLTIEITGKEVKPLQSENPTFLVDGKIVQLLTVPTKNFTDKKLTENEYLEAHKTWEVDYLSEEIFKKKLEVESLTMTIGTRKGLFWGFTRPNNDQEYNRDFYMTTVVGSYILGLSSPVQPTVNKTELQKLFTGFMETLKVSNTPFDIDKLAQEIKKGTKKPN